VAPRDAADFYAAPAVSPERPSRTSPDGSGCELQPRTEGDPDDRGQHGLPCPAFVERGGSVELSRSRAFSKEVSTSVLPPLLRASAGRRRPDRAFCRQAMNVGDQAPRLGAADVSFPVLRQTAASPEPRIGPLNHPAPRLDFEARGGVGPLDDLDPTVALAFQGVAQLRPGIAAVSDGRGGSVRLDGSVEAWRRPASMDGKRRCTPTSSSACGDPLQPDPSFDRPRVKPRQGCVLLVNAGERRHPAEHTLVRSQYSAGLCRPSRQ
jgi:hypothetical protein